MGVVITNTKYVTQYLEGKIKELVFRDSVKNYTGETWCIFV